MFQTQMSFSLLSWMDPPPPLFCSVCVTCVWESLCCRPGYHPFVVEPTVPLHTAWWIFIRPFWCDGADQRWDGPVSGRAAKKFHFLFDNIFLGRFSSPHIFVFKKCFWRPIKFLGDFSTNNSPFLELNEQKNIF